MKFNKEEASACLKRFDFKTLFREYLGWDNHQAKLDIPVNGKNYNLSALAHKRGFTAYLCPTIPDTETRKKIDREVTKSAREHFIIYADQSGGEQIWQWVPREPGKPQTSRNHRYHISQSGEPLIQKLEHLAVSIDEEETLSLVGVAGRARAAFDLDKITKRFFDRFKAEHTEFLKFIKGIAADADLQWYTSLMLNRLMFVYFIQKKGFLDDDTDYLRNRLELVRHIKGKDQFHSFYRYFLRRLFHDGLGKSPDERQLEKKIEKLLGKVPFLNGGFFETHELEHRYPDIDIPDKAFEKLFDFFDQYAWHLDERPLRADNEINPDVVGYIFEKYVNQKQMGAYYTKEDITEYISKNTIIPFLFDAARQRCAVAFTPESALWRLLRDDPDRYLYPAVRHGVILAEGSTLHESKLPGFVQTGMHNPLERMHDQRYNLQQAPKDDPIRLVTETWREYASRRTRCLEIRARLLSGEVHDINELITLNLDIWQFARDAIVSAEGPELLRAFWHAIEKVTVLDPTCGSGAFLFAALRILETLYGDCLERMERFIEDLHGKPHHPEQYSDFRKVLDQIAKHPNEHYFILKSIIINNLFGVDIMEEAVEICKLRLFLKLVAQVEKVEQIEPLPDIDFNIRAGNTLVGYATLDQVRHSMEGDMIKLLELPRIEESAEIVSRAFRQFRDQQTTYGGMITHKDKQDLRTRLNELDEELDRYLAGEYGINVANQKKFDAWKASHQPFHWLVEFYGIMHSGGFDVIIGNPPYVEYTKTKKAYTIQHYFSEQASNLYAYVSEQSFTLMNKTASFGFIVPISIICTQRMQALQELISSKSDHFWVSNYAERPGKLFAGAEVLLTIALARSGAESCKLFSTGFTKWSAEERPTLFDRVTYSAVAQKPKEYVIPKSGQKIEIDLLSKIIDNQAPLALHLKANTSFKVFYRIGGGRYWKIFTNFQPKFILNGKQSISSRESHLFFISKEIRNLIIATLSSSLFYWYFILTTNCRDMNPTDLKEFPIDVDKIGSKVITILDNLCDELMTDYSSNSIMRPKTSHQTGEIVFEEFYPRLSKSIIDQIDKSLASHYGFTDEEIDFIINYDIKYRMGAGSHTGD